MKPPVNIEALMGEWEKDCKVDSTEPGKELLNIPMLHGKYLNIMTVHNLLAKKMSYKYNTMKQIKFEYYAGNLNNPEDLAKYNLEPFLQKISKPRIPEYLDSDEELNTLLLKKLAHEEIVDYCKSVLKELNNRTFQIRGYLDYVKFTHGNG